MALTRRSKVVKAVAQLLEGGAETPEDLALEAIKLADEMRALDTGYFVVQQYGAGPGVWYRGIGPFSTRLQAEKAVKKMPELELAKATAIVPTASVAGWQKRQEEVDSMPKLKGDWALVKQDAKGGKKRG